MDEQELKQYLDIDYMELIYEDETVSIVECLVLHEGVNRNKCNLTHEIVIDALPTLANKPIWGIPNSKFLRNSSSDFIEHARTDDQKEDIMIFGVFPESGVKNAEFIEKDGKIYLKVQAILFKIYAPIAMDILKRRDGNVKISIEINAKGIQLESGILDVSEFEFLSAACLGINIKEGIQGSQMDIIRFSLDESIQKFNEHYLSFKEKEDQFEIPKSVKDNAQEALNLRKEYGRGMTSIGVSIAKYLVENKYADYEKIKTLSQYFQRHTTDDLALNGQNGQKLSNSYISFQGYGGIDGWKWVKEIINIQENKNKEGDQVKGDVKTFVSEEDLGSKGTIKINKSKDAMSEKPWGDEDKSQLKKDCFMASNWKAVCKAVFQKLEEGWLDGKEGSLGYPVMEKIGDEVVYSRAGLGNAKARASGNNEEDVLSKLKSIYNHLDLPWGDEKEIKKNSQEDGEKMDEEVKTNAEEVDEKTIDNAEKEKSEDKKFTEIEIEIEPSDGEVSKDGSDDGIEEMKAKYAELEQKFADMEKEYKMAQDKLLQYAKQEEMCQMSALLDQFCHCYDDGEIDEIKNKMSTMTYAELDGEIAKKAKEFALKAKTTKVEKIDNTEKEDEVSENGEDSKEKDDGEKEVVKNKLQFSVSPFGIIPTYDFSKNLGSGSLEDIINNSGVKMSKK